MRVLQVTDSLAVESGGTAAACAQLTGQLARSRCDVSILSCAPDDARPAWRLDPRIPARRTPPAGPPRLGFCPGFSGAAASLPRPDVVHIHGLWRLHYWQAARYARELRIPSVVSVHGMLYRQALAEHGGFKRLARWLYQDGVLQTAACLHATAADEIVEIRRLGFSKPIAMIPWGVDIPDHAEVSRIDQQLTSPRRTVLYFGRLHPRKGLDRLLHAWSRLARDGCRLVLAGGDADGYQSTLTSLASELGISDSVEWAGIRSGADRERLFANATVLVLPSAYENFGLVIPEALARGVPVIATHGAPWASLVEERCGWWIEPGVDALAAALSDALGRSGDELRAMGERGRRFAGSRFRWPCVSNAMCELYEWVLGAGPRPAFVDGRPS